MVRLRHFSKSRVLYIVMICDFRVELLGSFVLVCSGADAEGLHNRCEREQVCAMHSGENQTDGLRQRRYHLPARYPRLGQYWRGDRLGDGLPGGDNGTDRHGADGADAGSEGLVESCTSTAPRPASKARNSRNPPLDHEQFAMATGGGLIRAGCRDPAMKPAPENPASGLAISRALTCAIQGRSTATGPPTAARSGSTTLTTHGMSASVVGRTVIPPASQFRSHWHRAPDARSPGRRGDGPSGRHWSSCRAARRCGERSCSCIRCRSCGPSFQLPNISIAASKVVIGILAEIGIRR